MTKKVIIHIEGIQPETKEDSIEVEAQGVYRKHGTKHYIHYKESSQEDDIIINIIKIAPQKIEMIKKGSISTQMFFDIEKDTQAIYRTPFGNLHFSIHTVYMNVVKREEEMSVDLHYTLSSDNSILSENKISINIRSNE